MTTRLALLLVLVFLLSAGQVQAQQHRYKLYLKNGHPHAIYNIKVRYRPADNSSQYKTLRRYSSCKPGERVGARLSDVEGSYTFKVVYYYKKNDATEPDPGGYGLQKKPRRLALRQSKPRFRLKKKGLRLKKFEVIKKTDKVSRDSLKKVREKRTYEQPGIYKWILGMNSSEEQ